jgi:fructose-1,6-bisphosphatase/inositol monophosphatase family enzyme
MSQVVSQGHGDISYKIDFVAESKINELGGKLATSGFPCEIIAEGIGKKQYLGNFSSPQYSVIIDPIDGTRGLMYNFRSAFVLTGVAPYKTDNTLSNIEVAVQTEIPTSKQDRVSILWAIKGKGAHHQIIDFKTNDLIDIPLYTSSAQNLDHGFAVFSNFFPGVKGSIGRMAD